MSGSRRVCIWTPDKDLAQCVRDGRVVQIDRKSKAIRDEKGVRDKYGVNPVRIPDFLALVGDTADGYPGLDGVGKATAAKLVNKYGAIETFPPDVLGEQQELALKFKELATLKADLPLFKNVDALRWKAQHRSSPPGPLPPGPASYWSAVRRPAPRLVRQAPKAGV